MVISFYNSRLTAVGDCSLEANRLLPAAGTQSDASWTPATVAAQFGSVPLVGKILSEPFGLNRQEYDHWHPGGPEGKD